VVRDTEFLAQGLARRIVDTLDGKQVPSDPIQDSLMVRCRQSA
jgi:hypothetical protein